MIKSILFKLYGSLLYRVKSYLLIAKTESNWFFRSLAKRKSHNLNKPLIISLTSFSKRFQYLDLTIKCLINQTVKVDRIVLWIDKEDVALVPQKIIALKEYGLEIYSSSSSIKSYKKIIPTLELYPDTYVVTVDDDLYYQPTLVENLINCHSKFPEMVIANRTHVIKKLNNGKLASYNDWSWETFDDEDLTNNFLTGVGGVLYPPNIFLEIF